MDVKETSLKGCYELYPVIHRDVRGAFIKTFQTPVFRERGLMTDFVEEYHSVSSKNVLRGMHFQIPPADGAKLVYCIEGTVFDAVIDLRKDSSTYGEYFSCQLNAQESNMLYIPTGMAHGFCVLSDKAVMMYKVTSLYSQMHDQGIRWNSVGIPWPVKKPILSERDQRFPLLQDYVSPF